MEHVDLIAGSVRVRDHQSRPDDVEGGVDVHGIGISERDHVYVMLVPEVAPHPVDTEGVGHLTVCMLCAYVHVQPGHTSTPCILCNTVQAHNLQS